MSDLPTEGMELIHILVVGDIERSRSVYRNVLGASVYREYASTSCMLKFQGSWLLLVTGGEPTEDKPGVALDPPSDPVSHTMTIRVSDCETAPRVLKSRGAEFLTPPTGRGAEIRCFFRDPDGHLLEISQAR